MSTATTADVPPRPPTIDADPILPSAEVRDALGQTVREALRLGSWSNGPGLEDLLTRVRSAVARSVGEEAKLHVAIRERVLAELRNFPDAPAAAGVYAIAGRHLRQAGRNLVLAGQVTACDGAQAGHDALTANVVTIGVCLLRFDGAMNSWRTTFLRHDYDARSADPVGQLRAVLDRRGQRAVGGSDAPDQMSILLRRGFLAAAERCALLERAGTRWKFGHGVPVPLELLTGAGCPDLIDLALPVSEQLLLTESRWAFLPEGLSSRVLLTVANALEPGQLAIFQKGKPMLEAILETANFPPGYRRRVEEFARRLGEATVVGGFRATRFAPAQLFVAHGDRAVEAGILAMADGGLSPHRGFPLSLELASTGARTNLGLDAFRGVVESAYAQARAGHLYDPARSSDGLPA